MTAAPGTSIEARATSLRGRTVLRADVDAPTRERMCALLGAHFTGVSRRSFEEDLAAKTAVILLEDAGGVLRGFSTLLVYDTTAADRPLTVVYSGDTIVERPWWGSPTLARTWIQSVRRLTASAGSSSAASAELYWLLLTSGFRTYRFLPVFYRSFFPRFDVETPARTQAIVDAVASAQFGQQYDRGRGIVRLARPQVLAGDLLAVPAGRDFDPHVRFFLERNPGYVQGDELVCLTRIDDANLTPAGLRMARAAGEVSV
jgi:hypothetical protein